MRRNSIFAFILYIAILWTPQYVEAQSAPVSPWYEEGNASWYGEEFSGRPTASGEFFNPALFTAAHPTLPFGTFLTVTNKYNNLQVTVKVNDRGPFVASRIIDLSEAAARQIGMIEAGTVPVIIEQLSSSYIQPPDIPVVSAPAPIQPPPPPPPPVPQYAAPAPIQPPPPPPPPPPVPQYAAPAPIYQPAPPPPPVPQYAAPAPIYQPAPPPPPYPMDPSAPEAANPYPPITVNVYPSGQPQAQPPAPPPPPAQLQPQAPPIPPTQFQPQYAPPLPPPAQFLPPAQPQYAQPLPPPAQFPPQAQPQYAPPLPPPAQFQPPAQPQYTQPLPSLEPLPAPAIKFIPAITPLPGSLYKIQVGSYKVPRHAVDAFDKLKAAGLNPSYEPNGEFYRVVLTRVPGIEVQSVADKLARAGFREALIREER